MLFSGLTCPHYENVQMVISHAKSMNQRLTAVEHHQRHLEEPRLFHHLICASQKVAGSRPDEVKF
jgi:hypothetical protein